MENADVLRQTGWRRDLWCVRCVTRCGIEYVARAQPPPRRPFVLSLCESCRAEVLSIVEQMRAIELNYELPLMRRRPTP